MSIRSSGSSLEHNQPEAYFEEPIEDPSQYNIYYENGQDKNVSFEDTIKQKSTLRKYLLALYPDWILEHRDWISFKTILPTFFQVWATVFILVVNKAALWMGRAPFILQIFGFVLSSGGLSVSINTILALVCMVYVCYAWLIATICFAITAKIRGWPTKQSIAEQLIAEGTCSASNISQCLRNELFTGRFLETRCTVIWILGLIVGIVSFGLPLKYHPMARQPYVCGSINLTINVCYGVFFPFFDPMAIGLTLFKPMAFAFAMKILVSCLIFPFTSNYKYLKGATGVFKEISKVCEKNARFVSTMKPSLDSFKSFKDFQSDVHQLRVKLPPLDVFISSCRFEISFGRFDAGDVAEIRSIVKPLMTTLTGFQFFYELFDERREMAMDRYGPPSRRGSLSSESAVPHGKLSALLRHHYAKVGTYESKKSKRVIRERLQGRPEKDRIRLADLDHIADHFRQHDSEYFHDVAKLINVVVNWLEAANEFRTYSVLKWKSHVQTQRQQHESLREAREEFQKAFDKLSGIRHLHNEFADTIYGDEQRLCLVSQTSLFIFMCTDVGRQLLTFVDLLLEMDETRPTPKLITMFTRTKHDKHSWKGQDVSEEVPHSVGEKKDFRILNRDPDALDPETSVQVVFYYLLTSYRWLMNQSRLWFWIRVGILINVCACPYYVRTTASWYFDNRLIWLPIVCAISTSEYTAETVYMFISKCVYSLFGVISGCIAWYISTGKGHGNHYGYTIVTGFLYFFLCYYRHFAIHSTKVPNILTTVTPTLVLGTSWVDAVHDTSANIGYGLRVAIVRYISVVIGLAVAFLASTFPVARSSKVAVRRIMANALENSSELFCRVTTFALDRQQDPNVHIKARHDTFGDFTRRLLSSLATAKSMMGPIQYEVAITGAWPEEKYMRLHSLITDIIQLYYLLYRTINQIEDTQQWIPLIVSRAGWADSDLVADILGMVNMSAGSLNGKSPLPKITSATIAVRHLEAVSDQFGLSSISMNDRIYKDVSDEEESDLLEDEVKLGYSNLSREGQLRNRHASINYAKMLSHDGQLNVICLLLTHLIYTRIDEAVLVVKGLVGEKYDISEDLFSA